MKILQITVLLICLMAAHQAQSQAGGLAGYKGRVVAKVEIIVGGDVGFRHDITPVAGAELDECIDKYNLVLLNYPAEDIILEGESASWECAPNLFFRSPTAPGSGPSPAATLWPAFPSPPVCLSCPFFNYPVIKELYPDHVGQVMGVVKNYKVDQFNAELKALQDKYNLEGFESEMFELEKELAGKGK